MTNEVLVEKKCHIISCNDMKMFCVIGGDEYEAVPKMTQLQSEYWEKNKGHFQNYRDYLDTCNWNIRTVNGTEKIHV